MTLAARAAHMRSRLAEAEQRIAHSLDDHLPEIESLGASLVVRAYEANELPPKAEALIADLIRLVGTPRPENAAGAQIPGGGAESPQEPLKPATDTPIADEALQALSGGPVVGGQAR